MRPSVPTATAVAIALTASVAAAVASQNAAASTPPPPARLTARSVHLITGDSVAVYSVAGQTRTAVIARSRQGIAGQFTRYRAGGDQYVIPGAARRYLGTVLDRSLFDVTALAKQTGTGRLPVSLRLAPGAKPAVPGLTLTSHTTTAAQGYLTAAGTRLFGAALAKQAVADGRAHRTPTRLFGGVTRIATPGVVTAPVTPAFQQYTLQVKVIDPSGKPADFADVILTNIDDGRKFTNELWVVNGLAKVSVPAGTYSGMAQYDVFGRTTSTAYLVPREEFDVTTNNQSMVFDTRKATTVPSVHTPRRATVVDKSLEWDRITKKFFVDLGWDFEGGGFSVRVAPTGDVTKGRLEWVTGWSLASSPSTGAGYTYDLSFHDSGRVPANQNHTVTSAQLARVNARYYTDARSRVGYFGRAAFYPFQFGVGGGLFPVAAPRARTEYVYGDPTARFLATLIAAPTDDDPDQGLVFDGDRAYPSGTTRNVDWLRGPLAPGIQAQTAGEQLYFCDACRDDTTLALGFAPYVDTTPGHGGTFDLLNENQVGARFKLYRNGTLIDNQVNYTGDYLTVPSGAATYRAVTTVYRSIAGFHTSTATSEDVTFRSSATSGATAPAGWLCPNEPPCTVLPILQATVPLPTDLASRLPVGATSVIFSVGYNQRAGTSAIGNVTFAITTNGGASYHPLPVTSLGHGKYRVTLVNAASSAGHGVGVRVGATDAAGGKLVETVQNAYVVASR